MVVGFAKDGRPRNVIGSDTSFIPAHTKAQILSIAQNMSAVIGGADITADDIILNEDYVYPVITPTRSMACRSRRRWRPFA
jgi:1-aminocyclopropane-1-carboxylate deaminase